MNAHPPGLETGGQLRPSSGIDAEPSCIEALSVRRGLHGFASARGADLLVVAASGPDDLARVFVGDDTSDVLEDPPCAVAIAPPGYYASQAQVSRIGVAYNGSPESEVALGLPRVLARPRQADVSAFEAVGAGFFVRDPSNAEGEMEERVTSTRTRLSAPEAQVGFGDTVEELSHYGQSVGLLVIGGHRHRPLDHLLQGSTAQQLADRASTALLVLPAVGDYRDPDEICGIGRRATSAASPGSSPSSLSTPSA